MSPGVAAGPPAGLPGLDPRWSRTVRSPDAGGVPRTWHLLDNGPSLQARDEPVAGTVLCVHGNPTWSYLWRRVLAQAAPGWRVVAVDQLGMGYSERPDGARTLAQRVGDLSRLTATLQLTGPVVLLAHDWGGPIGLGWALRHTDRLAGVVLTNTAVHQPADSSAPTAIRIARSAPLLDVLCRHTPGFVQATTATCRPRLPGRVRGAFAAPYATADRRRAVADFVADIPLSPDHPSHPALSAIASGLDALRAVPALLVWGPQDPVFGERYLRDLLGRLPHADVHRFPGASHLVLEDRPEGVELIWEWIGRLGQIAPAPPPRAPNGVPIAVHAAEPGRPAIVQLGKDGGRITFRELQQRVTAVARGLHGRGVRPGQRVAVLVPPGIDLTTLVYAVWQLGAVVVVADAGLGLRRLGAALRGAGPDHVVGISRGLALARAAGVPGRRTAFGPRDVEDLVRAGEGMELPGVEPDGGADGAVLFTSGATGPPKGVVYTRDRLSAQVAVLRDTFDLAPGERFVAAFAPFALYGPALGLSSAVPDMEVTAPHTLTAAALAEAVAAVDASVVFASPAALRNVVATAGSLTTGQRRVLRRPRLVLSAGAPVPATLLRRVKELLPAADTHTPYGMTEVLPVSTVDPTALGDTARGDGVCVGLPLPGVEVRLAPLRGDGTACEELVDRPGVTGEIVVRAAHTKERYDRLWGTQRASERPAGWHRTGDVGRMDEGGRLWVHGRLAHVVSTPAGPVPPYGVEQRVEALPDLVAAAMVGVGPVGTQHVVVVVVPRNRQPRRRLGRLAPRLASPLAGHELAGRVRAVAGVPVAAVLLRDWLPVDIRHASKVDRTALAQWVTALLHGRVEARALARSTGRAPTTRSR